MSYIKKYTNGAGISAVIVLDSISEAGDRMTTFEIEYPRFIHSEIMTHRMLSKNCASSRAIPVAKMLEMIRNEPAVPVWWGKNQPGMSAKEEITGDALAQATRRWVAGANDAADLAEAIMAESDLHKQITNRITEPWQRMKTVISGTEWKNFFHLRCHPDAQPEFQAIATLMKQAMDASEPFKLKPGEWHVPYVSIVRAGDGPLKYMDSNHENLTAEEAIKISVSCCAQVSYRKLDETKDKAIAMYDRLVNADVAHASPLEHQASPMVNHTYGGLMTFDPGVSHMGRNGRYWSGNLCGFVQYRKTLDNEAVW